MFKQISNDLWPILKPPRLFSWQSLFLCSLLIWGLSFVAGYFNLEQQQSLATWGFLLLTLGGVFWAIEQKPLIIRGISMGPWLAAVLVSTFIYRYLNQVVGSPARDALYVAAIVWPLIAALLKIIPDLIRTKPRLGLAVKPIDRTGLAIFLMMHFMIAFWIRFGFMVQDWAIADPSLASGDPNLYRTSMFVVPLDLFR